MCIVLWALDHQDYAVIICSNRDELLSRPTLDAHFHNFQKEGDQSILSGLDVQGGGTWFGVNRAGRIAVITNITEPAKAYEHSRGYLTSSFLLSDEPRPLEDEVHRIVPQDANFAGFNLLLLAPDASDSDELHFHGLMVTNHGSGGTIASHALSTKENVSGCVSNAIGGENAEWPKVRHASHNFHAVLKTLKTGMSEDELVGQLFELLSWKSPEPVTERAQLRKTVQVQPLQISLGPIGVGTYGTRLSTILLIRKSGEAVFIERDIWQLVNDEVVKANPTSQRTFHFRVEPIVSPISRG